MTSRLSQRSRPLQRNGKIDENANATTRHVRQGSGIPIAGGHVRRASKELITGTTKVQSRTALGEVTKAAVNRKDTNTRIILGKGTTTDKRGRLDTDNTITLAGANKGKAAPPVASITSVSRTIPLQSTTNHIAPSASQSRRFPVFSDVPLEVEEDVAAVDDVDMDVEEPLRAPVVLEDPMDGEWARAAAENAMADVEDMLDIAPESDMVSEEEEEEQQMARIWPDITPGRAQHYERQVQYIKDNYVEEPDEVMDPSMVSEYADEIFAYMNELEEQMMPGLEYANGERESDFDWETRGLVVDWLQQVHIRYHLMPETLWTAINIMDRFLSLRVVAKVKLQLVGLISMFVAAKYEEILAPSLEEFASLADNEFTKDDILKGERIMLQTLEFRVSHYCSPYSWMRKISKADEYDIQTRTLSKFLTEVTLLDHRFLRVKPNMIAAVGMYTARVMLSGEWDEHFIYHSGYTKEQLMPGHEILMERLSDPYFTQYTVCKKYAEKKFLKAAVFALRWAKMHPSGCTN